ncbi:ester cyclase [Streptomyces sp. NA02950]|uniref:ester cyclase n=1 Tax=Streptomyces sp. NA02950 TaxID=2742137 RepID=UPI00159169F0|nr:ester cyclase [Streptomyces sp. NA02950]QKV96010.1 ester cyclase [Streptomyces sp. NA02950]
MSLRTRIARMLRLRRSHRYGIVLGSALLVLLAAANIPTATAEPDATDATTPSTAAGRQRPSAWVPEGGLSRQARATLARSAVARTALLLYRPFESGDAGIYDRILAEDYVDVPLAPGQGTGREGMKQHVLDDIVATFPDLRVRIDAIHVSGSVVTFRETLTGTQVRPFLGVPATHRGISFRATDVHHLAHGRIMRTDHLEDFYGAYRQMTQP